MGYFYRDALAQARLEGANLSGAENITQDQIDEANGDEHTKLPPHSGQPRALEWQK